MLLDRGTIVTAVFLLLAGHSAANDKSPSIDEIVLDFTAPVPYQRQGIESIKQALQDTLHDDPDSVFLPGSRLTPLTRALLKLEAVDGAISPARFRLRYGQVQIPNPPKADPLTISLVQVDRFNLGPARYSELKREHGAANVRADSFADSAHVSWRFAMRPVMGTTAMTAAAARARIPQAFAETMDCLGAPCTATTATEPAMPLDWESAEAPTANFEADYDTRDDGVPSPAALLDLLLVESHAATRNDGITWRGFEPREGLAEGTPLVDIVIETGLGQDSHIAGLLRDDYLMDHETRTQWIRLRTVATTPDRAPILDLARAFVPWPRPQFD